MRHATTAVIVKGFPRLSNTFVAQELAALERCGLPLRIYTLRKPDTGPDRAVGHDVAAPVIALPPLLLSEPGRLFRAWRAVRGRPGYRVALRAWRADLRRGRALSRLLYFGLACIVAAEKPDEVGRFYAHFLDGPGSVARYASLMTGIPWCCFAHADIWAMPDWEKREKLAAAEWVATCTATGRDHLAALSVDRSRIELVYHGMDPALGSPVIAPRPPRDGADERDPVRILSVGRTVEKKGYDVLLEALSRLPRELSWRFDYIGEGPLLKRMKARARALGLSGRIAWLGPLPRTRVLEHCHAADLFALASRVAANGRRDGLPNVLLEAQSTGLACVSTTVSAIPELILDRQTGLLVPPDDSRALARALERLIRDPGMRTRLGVAAAERVRRHFDMWDGIRRLAARFGVAADIGTIRLRNPEQETTDDRTARRTGTG
ncbi:MAG: glycosyltransferase [Alphaproteobacteria bacterium]